MIDILSVPATDSKLFKGKYHTHIIFKFLNLLFIF